MLLETHDTGYATLARQEWYHIPGIGAFIVGVGFQTDMATIPRFARSFFPLFGSYQRAAVLHDYLYQSHITTRAQADYAFREVMRQAGTGEITRWSMWLAVRAFGWRYWSASHSKKVKS
jgi:hypothetical protein